MKQTNMAVGVEYCRARVPGPRGCKIKGGLPGKECRCAACAGAIRGVGGWVGGVVEEVENAREEVAVGTKVEVEWLVVEGGTL